MFARPLAVSESSQQAVPSVSHVSRQSPASLASPASSLQHTSILDILFRTNPDFHVPFNPISLTSSKHLFEPTPSPVSLKALVEDDMKKKPEKHVVIVKHSQRPRTPSSPPNPKSLALPPHHPRPQSNSIFESKTQVESALKSNTSAVTTHPPPAVFTRSYFFDTPFILDFVVAWPALGLDFTFKRRFEEAENHRAIRAYSRALRLLSSVTQGQFVILKRKSDVVLVWMGSSQSSKLNELPQTTNSTLTSPKPPGLTSNFNGLDSIFSLGNANKAGHVMNGTPMMFDVQSKIYMMCLSESFQVTDDFLKETELFVKSVEAAVTFKPYFTPSKSSNNQQTQG
eukprot:GDKJ01013091.1.p1 GENE.GDKJ01013091.1~~GDKJ01013091.1.p1  ORF type:complete len:341 (+),score=84.51 GDKJ01013091.1:52-1074(+)